MKLFDDDWGVDKSDIEDIQITTTMLYFSKKELREFKKLCKIGIQKTYGEEYQTKGNLSYYLLKILRDENTNL